MHVVSSDSSSVASALYSQMESVLDHLTWSKDNGNNDSHRMYYALVDSVAEHLHRDARDAGAQTRGGKLKKYDLYTEAERILSKVTGGLSLLERLARDPTLRSEVRALLDELNAQPTTQPAQDLVPLPGKPNAKRAARVADPAEAIGQADTTMKDVLVTTQNMQHVTMAQKPG